MDDKYTFKPSKLVFVYWSVLRSVIALCIVIVVPISIAIFIVGYPFIFIGIGLVLLILLSLLVFITQSFQYKKEQYVFHKTKIARNYGGIFSQAQTELIAKNLTHITLELPWVEYSLFKTGSILIESAGSGGVEIKLSSIKNPFGIYDQIKQLMRLNGFSLSKTNLIQQEKPSLLGVSYDVVSMFSAVLFGFFVFFGSMFANLLSETGVETVPTWGFLIFGLIALILFVFLFARGFFQILDALKRRYYLYSDLIEYEDGFLNRVYSFIPIENLSDSNTSQNFFERIVGLYDVVLSCQGSGPEIRFKNIKDGMELDGNLDKLIDELSRERKLKDNMKDEGTVLQVENLDTQLTKESSDGSVKGPSQQMQSEFTAQIRPYILKAILVSVILFIPSIIFFPLAPVVLIVFIIALINGLIVRYQVNKNSIESKVSFLTTKNIKFTCDKITGVIIKQDLIDKILNTCSIKFWSIGTYEDLTFANIKKDEKLIQEILKKVGLFSEGRFFDNSPKFDLLTFVKKDLIGLFFMFFGSCVAIVTSVLDFDNAWFLLFIPFALLLGALYSLLLEYIKIINQRLFFFEDFVYFKQGWIATSKYLARFINIKDITTHHYFLAQKGSLIFEVAGEHMVYNTNQSSKVTLAQFGTTAQTKNPYAQIISNSFKADYVCDISLQDELVDFILDHNPSLDKIAELRDNIRNYIPDTLLVIKPSVLQAVVSSWFLCLLFIPTVIGPFLVLFFSALQAGKTQYVIQSNRVLKKWGIFTLNQKSIIFDRIDHLNYTQGFWGKIFKTGTITVNTTGSSQPELVIANIPDFMSFYEELERHYAKSEE